GLSTSKTLTETLPQPPRSGYYISFPIIVIIAAVAIIIQYTLLPAKYFYDSNHILNLMESGVRFKAQNSFSVTVFLSGIINIFNFNSLFLWSLMYAVIFNPLLYVFFKKTEVPTLPKLIWIYAFFGLLNIYVFNLSKDIFQFVLFFIIALIVLKKGNTNRKLVYCASILFLWGFIFRIYFLLIAVFFLMTYILFNIYLYGKKKRSLYIFIVLALTGILLSLLAISRLAPEEYNTIIFTHSRLTVNRVYSPDSQTLILDVIRHNGNLALFMLNYVINMFRMMLPVELLFRFNVSYLLFFSFQVMLTYYLLKTIKGALNKKATPETLLALFLYLGYLMGSVLFEPDFGSWVRHEAALFPILVIIIFSSPKREIST
ncbi:MAG: hypothetical protein FWG69_06315, partial [Oscillospiraceae bacterium]|nr:hypothetical protein [Oscillospiraceae bacterium]